ncbi:maestro heat-like repeat-containing protein family member 1 isoform X2 [Daktulosphaira vitifoliae]|uniref:maestro heat-like repeat-containing protein family member 1 isoform X2 n=1 Tax=Daktulosphaira vitifoliae TaxID=58002 RepID=UPI0021AAAA98|nr:maestro heat-like repeat-containing protein family member 1 isoform X2 [Daktulosphaira vitifoliae]
MDQISDKESDEILNKNINIQSVTNRLLHMLTVDREERVLAATKFSLQQLSETHSKHVIQYMIHYKLQNSLSVVETKTLLSAMKVICENHLNEFDTELIDKIVQFAKNEMIKSSDSQFPASDILITLDREKSEQIIENLMDCLQDGIPPHCSIIYSLGHLASNNPLKFINFVEKFLSIICSIINLIKSDAHRKIYSTAIGQVCASVIECESTDFDKVRQKYSAQVENIFKVINHLWLISRDVKVYECVLESLSSIIMLLSKEMINNNVIQILTSIMNLYKKCSAVGLSRYWITQYLASFLSVASENLLDPVVDNLFLILNEMVVVIPDYDYPMSMKNHSEVLRCYTYLGQHYGGKIIEIIMRDLQSNTDQAKMGALLIASHLLNASNQSIKSKSSEIIPILYEMLKSNSTFQMKNLLVKIFICFAYQGHLSEKDDFFIEFLIRNICNYSSSNNKYSQETEGQQIKQTCEDALYILCTSVDLVQILCWNKLLTCFLSPEYDCAVSSITKSLAHMATKPHLRAIRFARENDVIVLRCLHLLCQPFKENRGNNIIHFLMNYGFYDLSDGDKEFWIKHADIILHFLDTTTENNDKEWEIISLSTLSIILEEEKIDKHWCLQLTEKILEDLLKMCENTKMLSSYEFFIIKIISKVSAYYDSRELTLTKKLLNLIFHSLSKMAFENTFELSDAIGIISRVHTEIVVKHLLDFMGIELNKQPNKFLVLIRDKGNELNRDKIRLSIATIIPNIIVNGELQSVISTMYDIAILITQQIGLSKNLETKKSLVQCLGYFTEIMGKVENSDTIPNLNIIRDIVIKILVEQISNFSTLVDYIYYEVLCSFIKPVADIEPIDLGTRSLILTNCVTKIFQLSSLEIDTRDEKQILLTLNHLCNVIDKLIIIRSGSYEVIDELVKYLDPYIISKNIYQRFIASQILQNILNCYYNHSNYQMTKLPQCLNSPAPLFAQLCIRLGDPDEKIRINISKCLEVSLKITAVYKGTFTEIYIKDSKFIDKIMSENNPNSYDMLFETIKKILNPADLSLFAKCLIDGLSDYEEECQLKTSEILIILFPLIAQLIPQKSFNEILEYLFKKIDNDNETIKSCNIQALNTFGKYNKSEFLELLINQSLPYNTTVCTIWQNLGKQDINTQIIDTLLEFVTLTPLYDNSSKKFLNKPIASLIPVAALSGLNEILKQYPYDCAIQSFPDLFNITFLTLAALINVGSPIRGSNKNVFTSYKEVYDINPAKIAHETLYNLLKSISLNECSENVMNAITCLETTVDTIMHKLAPCIIKGLVESHPKLISKIINNFDKNVSSTLECQRIAIVVLCLCCAEAMSSDTKHTNSLINVFLKCLSDTSYVVRKYCLKGLTVICQHHQLKSDEQCQFILDALMQGIDEYQTQQTDVTLEALRGLISLISHLSLEQFEKHYAALTFRVKQFFENENNEMRCTSIRLYGELCSNTHSFKIDVDMSLLHNNIVTLLMHLCENDKNIVEACKFALKKVSDVLQSEKIEVLSEKYLVEDKKMKYSEFLTHMCNIITSEFVSHVSTYTMIGLSYTKSIFPDIRASAALFVYFTNLTWINLHST